MRVMARTKGDESAKARLSEIVGQWQDGYEAGLSDGYRHALEAIEAGESPAAIRAMAHRRFKDSKLADRWPNGSVAL